MSNFNWIFNSIFGSDEPAPARPLPAIPIIDTRKILDNPKRTTGLQRQLDEAERDAAIEKIFGSEMLGMVKNPSPSSVEPSTSTFNGQTLLTPVPEHVADPRKIECICPCQMCRSGSGCFNCLGDQDGVKCEFSDLRILDDILPVDPEEETQFRQAASARQRARMNRSQFSKQARLAKHKQNLAPALCDFKSALQPYSARVPHELFDNVLDSMSRFCADAVAAGG
jgi:hypothetical protein